MADVVEFINHKQAFFSIPFEDNKERVNIEAKAKENNYAFVATNRILLEQEVSQLFDSLKKTKNNEQFWLYLYYCCIMLKQCYEIYDKKQKVAEYEAQIEQIKSHLDIDCVIERKKKESYFHYLMNKIKKDLIYLIKAPTKISDLRDEVGKANIYRIYWYFCRTTLKNSLLLAQELHLLEKLGNVLGKQISAEKIIHNLEIPNEIFRFLSVGFFAARLIMNTGMLLKHTVFASDKERKLNWEKRLYNEVYKRHPTMINDVVWGVVNLVTNYNEAFGIAAPVAGGVVALFLFFDICLIMWRRHLEEKEYETKKSQYRQEIKNYEDIFNSESADESKKNEAGKHIEILRRQLESLDITWQTANATYLWDAAAASFLMGGFSASMAVGPIGMVLASYIVCTIAVAMYLSESAYKNYTEKKLLLENAISYNDPGAIAKAMKVYSEARNDFIFTFSKNALMPALVIGAFAICWQAALVLTAIYIGVELYRSYSKHKESQKDIPEEDYAPIGCTA